MDHANHNKKFKLRFLYNTQNYIFLGKFSKYFRNINSQNY